MSKNSNSPWYVGANGATNATRYEARRRARELLESSDYKDSLTRRIQNDTLPAAVEVALWHYAYGKPTEHVELNVSQRERSLREMTVDELRERARQLSEQLDQAVQLDQAIPANYKIL